MAEFRKFEPKVKLFEGGYQAFANDPGNYNSRKELVGTKNGISARFYEQIIKRPPTVQDMKNINKDIAKALFKQYFWDKVKADQIKSQAVAEMVVDHAINAGNKPAVRILQDSLNKMGFHLKEDGLIGKNTLAATNAADPHQLFQYVTKNRKDFYLRLNKSWTPGWIARVNKLANSFITTVTQSVKKKTKTYVITGVGITLSALLIYSYTKSRNNEKD